MMELKHELSPGDRFLDFQIVRVLGTGGVGIVYEVVYRTKRQALKIIRPEWVHDPAMPGRMVREGQILTRIRHENIVEVHDAGIAPDESVWIRMELLHGANLRQVMTRSGPISLPRVCAFLRTAARAAHQCHLFGVIHRDIKPENFMVVRDEDGDEVLKLLDFGLAKVYGTDTRDLGLIGTPQYMAPEQWNKEMAVSPATDLYALCTLGHEMLRGYHPLFPDGKADNPWQMMRAHFEIVPPSLEAIGTPPEIAALLQRGVAKDPASRPQDALVWGEDLWRAWRRVRDRSPQIDTYPGEPSIDRIRSRPLVMTSTAPVSPWTKLPVGAAPLVHATTMRMYGAPRAGAFGLQGRGTGTAPIAGGGEPPLLSFDATAPIEREMEMRPLGLGPTGVEPGPRALVGTGTVPIMEGREVRRVPMGTTGTLPITMGSMGAGLPGSAALPFQPARSAPPNEGPSASSSVQSALRTGSAAPMPEGAAATAPLERGVPLYRATSGVRQSEPAAGGDTPWEEDAGLAPPEEEEEARPRWLGARVFWAWQAFVQTRWGFPAHLLFGCVLACVVGIARTTDWFRRPAPSLEAGAPPASAAARSAALAAPTTTAAAEPVASGSSSGAVAPATPTASATAATAASSSTPPGSSRGSAPARPSSPRPKSAAPSVPGVVDPWAPQPKRKPAPTKGPPPR
jgi:serine/threonine-protein kinase